MSALMSAAMFGQAASNIGSSYSQSQALQSSGAYEKSRREFNARVGEMRADDAIRRGEKEVSHQRKQISQVKGSSRASMAAQGIDVNEGVSRDIEDDIDLLGELEVLTIRNNATREAWGYKMQALDDRGAGNFAVLSAKQQSKATLLTGGMNALSSGVQGYYYADRG